MEIKKVRWMVFHNYESIQHFTQLFPRCLEVLNGNAFSAVEFGIYLSKIYHKNSLNPSFLPSFVWIIPCCKAQATRWVNSLFTIITQSLLKPDSPYNYGCTDSNKWHYYQEAHSINDSLQMCIQSIHICIVCMPCGWVSQPQEKQFNNKL